MHEGVFMTKGPKLNKTGYNFTARDNLGIEGATASIQADLCPVINTVTPRAFYWPFMVWNYYDYHVNYKTENKTSSDFDKNFLKKNDYFMVMANLIAKNDQNNLVGKTKALENLANTSVTMYPYDRTYFKTTFGGMQYYNAGCLTMGFITDEDGEGNHFSLARLTKEVGEPMVLAFEQVIKNTEYYKNYRLKDVEVPKAVLQELGQVLKFNLDGFDEVKALLKDALFTPKNNERLNNENLIKSSEYIKFMYSEYGITNPTLYEMRRVLFDYFSPRGEAKPYDDSLTEIVNDWEIVVGRQYLTMAVELMWKYMLWELNDATTLKKWVEKCLNRDNWNIYPDKPLKTLLPVCNYDFEEREKMISTGSGASKNYGANIETGLKILLSLYNRFVNRDELNENYLHEGDDVSISSLIKLVDEYSDKPIIEFIQYIMVNWIVKRHEAVAREKLLQGRDGFYFERIDDLYVPAGHLAEPGFKGLRLLQLMQVMKDLDMLEN